MTKMSNRHKAMAYVLHDEFGYQQRKIAQLMDVSQSTIASAIKDFKYQQTIRNLEDALEEARQQLEAHGIFPETPTLYLDD